MLVMETLNSRSVKKEKKEILLSTYLPSDDDSVVSSDVSEFK